MHFFVLLFLLISSAFAQEIMRTKIMMGTFVSITLSLENKEEMKPLFNIIKAVDSSLSSFQKHSPIYKLNQNKFAKLDLYSYEALELSNYYYKKTDGYFNVAIGKITKDLYCFGGDERVPKKEVMQKSNTFFTNLKFDKKEAHIFHNIKIDLGGMGKGFAVDKATEYLQINQIKKAKIAASGDIRCLGNCKIEVKNPFGSQALALFKTKQANTGISTSGNYEHFVQTKKHNHLINPKTKSSQQNFISITLIGTCKSSDLDAFTTAVSVMPKEKAFLFLKSIDVAYMILDTQKKLYLSENIENFVKDLLVNNTFKKYPKEIQD